MGLTPRQENIHWNRIYEQVGRIVGRLQGETATRFEDRQELVQECVFHVYKKLPEFEARNGCKEFSFIYSICRNHLINYNIFHTRDKRDYRKTLHVGLSPVNFKEFSGGEDPEDSTSHHSGYNSDNPESILQSVQLAEAMVAIYGVNTTFKEFVDWAWESDRVVNLTSGKAIEAFDGLRDNV